MGLVTRGRSSKAFVQPSGGALGPRNLTSPRRSSGLKDLGPTYLRARLSGESEEGWGGKAASELGAVPTLPRWRLASSGGGIFFSTHPQRLALGPGQLALEASVSLARRSALGEREKDGAMAPHPYPSLLSASQSLPTLTLRAPSPAAGGARSAAIPGSRPFFPRPSSPEPASGPGRRRVALRGTGRYVRLGSGSARGREGGGSWGRRGGGGRARARPGCAAAEIPAGGRRLQGSGWAPARTRPRPRPPASRRGAARVGRPGGKPGTGTPEERGLRGGERRRPEAGRGYHR